MTSQPCARQDAPIFPPLRRLSSPTGLPTFRPLTPPQFGKPGSSPLEDKPRGFPPFLTRILLKALTRPCSHIFFPPLLPLLMLPSLSHHTLATFLSVRRKSPLPFQNPPTPPLPALTRSLTRFGNGFTDHVLPFSLNSSLLCYTTDITPPP